MSRVVVVGSINVDLVTRVPRLPRPGETIIGGSFLSSPGGKGANQAAAAARLGADTWLVGTVGNDFFGTQARHDLERAGVNVAYVGVSPRPTGIAQIMVDANGENLIAVASGANADLTAEAVTLALREILTENTVVTANLEIPDEAVFAAAAACRQRGGRFVLNPAPARRLSLELLRLCDVLVPNEHEIDGLGLASPEELIAKGTRAVVVTRGPAGADVFEAGSKCVHQDAFPTEVVDTTGAGDAFTATLAWAIAARRTLLEAVRYAAAGGALATRAVGARGSPATRKELEDLLMAAGTRALGSS